MRRPNADQGELFEHDANVEALAEIAGNPWDNVYWP